MADREITLTTPLGPDRLLFAALEGQDEISGCFAFELAMVSEDIDIDPEELVGQGVTVSIGRDGPERHIHALVTDFGLRDLRSGYARYRATLRPALWLLSLRSDNRIFQNKSTVQILDEVLRAYPQVTLEKRLRKSYPPRDYCVQYGETDLDFLQRLLEFEGIFYFFEHSEGDHVLVVCDDSSRLPPAEGLPELPWQPDERANFLEGDFVVDWTASAAMRTSKFVHNDHDFERPGANLMADAKDEASLADDKAERYEFSGRYVSIAWASRGAGGNTYARADSLADIRIEEIQAARVRATARATAPALRSGVSFLFKGFPREAENVEHLVLRTRYRMWDGQYQTGMPQAGMGRPEVGCEVDVDLQPLAIPFRPERRTPWPRMRGPQTAVVVGPPGQEIFTDEYSRVKVQFHWDRQGKLDQNSSCFIRVSSAWAGEGWGFIQIPRIGQEVIVDFLEGDPDRPIITGRVYNAAQMPPYTLPAKATQSGWKSNSSPGGNGSNELRFEDKKGAEEVWFHAEKDHNEVIENDETRLIRHDWTEDVGHDAAQSVGHDRTESVGRNKSTSVGKDRRVDIGANDTEHVHANRSLTVDLDETIHVLGTSSEAIDKHHKQRVQLTQSILVGLKRSDKVGIAESRVVGATQTTTVGRKRSVRVGGTQQHFVKTDDSTTVNGKQSFKIGKDHGSEIGGDQTLKLGGNQSFEIGGGRLVKVGKGQTHDVAEDVWLRSGKKIRIEAADEITLACGDASVVLKKDGTISIKGKDIVIDGSGKITAKAGGDMILKGSAIHQN